MKFNFSDFMNEMNNLKEYCFIEKINKDKLQFYIKEIKEISDAIYDVCKVEIIHKHVQFKLGVLQVLYTHLNHDYKYSHEYTYGRLCYELKNILKEFNETIDNDFKEKYVNNIDELEKQINRIQELINDIEDGFKLKDKWNKVEYCSEDDKPINRLTTNFKDNINAYVIYTLSRLDDIKRNGGREKIVIKIDTVELEKMYPYLMGIKEYSTRSINNSQPVGNSNPFNSLYNLDFSGYDVEFVFKKNVSGYIPKDFCKNLLFKNCIFANFTVQNEGFDSNIEEFALQDCVILGKLKFIGGNGEKDDCCILDNLIINQLIINQCIIGVINLSNGEYFFIKILESIFLNNNPWIDDYLYNEDNNGISIYDNVKIKKYSLIKDCKGLENSTYKIDIFVNIIAVNNCEIQNIEIKSLGLYGGLEDKNFYLKLEAVKCKYVMLNVLEGEKVLGSKEKDNNKNSYLIEVFGSEIDSFNVRGDANNKIDILEYKYKQDVKSNVNRITFENLIFKDKCKVDINSSNKDSTKMMKFMNCVFKSFFILDYDYGDMKMANVKFDLDFLKNKELYEIGEFRRNLGYFCESLVDVMAKINHDNRKDLLLTNEIRANVFTIHEKRMELDKKINFDRERVVYYFNKWLAGYGANIWLPIAWMFGVNLSFVFLMWVVNSIDNKITLAIIGLSYVIFIYSLKYLFNNSVNKFMKKLFNSSMFELIKKIGKKIFDSKSYIVAFILAILILLSDAFDGNNNLFDVYYVNCIISINDLFKVDVFKIDVLKIYKDNYFLYYVKYFFSNFVPPLPDIIIGGHFDDGYTDMRKSWNPSMLWGFPKLVSSFMWYLIYKCVRFRNGG